MCKTHYQKAKYVPKPRKTSQQTSPERWAKWSRTAGGQYTTSKNKAHNAGKIFNLTKEEFLIARSGPCTYCGGELPETSLGLDRIDGPKGYVVGNVVPCCRNCNMLKGDMLTSEETKALINHLRLIRGGRVW